MLIDNYKTNLSRQETINWISERINEYGNKLIFTAVSQGHFRMPQYYIRADKEFIYKKECIKDIADDGGLNEKCLIEEKSKVSYRDLISAEIVTPNDNISAIHLTAKHVENQDSAGSTADAHRHDFFIYLDWNSKPDLLENMFKAFNAITG